MLKDLRNNMRWYVNLALLVLVGLGGCKSCESEKVEPCKPRKALVATFKAGQYISYYTEPVSRKLLFMPNDTIYFSPDDDGRTYIYFEPDDTNGVQYSWKIGSETAWRTGRKIGLAFDLPRTGNYPVTLRIMNLDTCERRDTSYIEHTGSFYIKNLTRPYVFGSYLGSFVSKPDSLFYVRIWNWYKNRLDSSDLPFSSKPVIQGISSWMGPDWNEILWPILSYTIYADVPAEFRNVIGRVKADSLFLSYDTYWRQKTGFVKRGSHYFKGKKKL